MATAKITTDQDINGLFYATWTIMGDGRSVHNPSATPAYKAREDAVEDARGQIKKWWKNSFAGRESREDITIFVD